MSFKHTCMPIGDFVVLLGLRSTWWMHQECVCIRKLVFWWVWCKFTFNFLSSTSKFSTVHSALLTTTSAQAQFSNTLCNALNLATLSQTTTTDDIRFLIVSNLFILSQLMHKKNSVKTNCTINYTIIRRQVMLSGIHPVFAGLTIQLQNVHRQCGEKYFALGRDG